MRVRRWIILLTLGLIALSLISLVRLFRRPSGSLNPLPYEYMGKVAAQEVARLLNDQGQIAVWRLRIDNRFDRPLAAAVHAFDDELRRFPSLTIVATEEDRVRTTGDLPIIANVPSSIRFMELMQRYQHVDALVFFGSVPALSAAEIARLPVRRPRVVMASIFQMPQRNLLARGVAQVVIAPRDHPHGDGQTQSAAEWFDCMYAVLTPATAETLRQ
jgi:ABC-type sugar transport system substrate-binding protein